MRGDIFRLRCQVCDATYSLHPDFLVRAHQYSRELICTWLLAWMSGVSFRSKQFLTTYAVLYPPSDGEVSWTDLLDDSSNTLRPRYQLLHRWSSRFSLHAARILPYLLVACLTVGCDVQRQVVPWLQRTFGHIRRGDCLALAIGLWVGLDAGGGEPVEAPSALSNLLSFLVARPLPPSHNARRASRGALRYDVLTHVGRAPT